MTSFDIEGTSKIHSGVVKWPGRGDYVVWEVSHKLVDGQVLHNLEVGLL